MLGIGQCVGLFMSLFPLPLPFKSSNLGDEEDVAQDYLEITDETTELPVSDLSPWSNQIRMAVMLSQEFFPYLNERCDKEK